mmetsp:Transcript_3689/g.7889  ORF Transcript_3689/g.7889 Transcript_3689/m.7889 type:complete len:151 (-) Transcript_3689:111-563(-)
MDFDGDSSFQYKGSFADDFDWSQIDPDTAEDRPRSSFIDELENSLSKVDQPNSELNEAILGFSDDEDASDLRNFTDAMRSSKSNSLLRSQRVVIPRVDNLQLTSRSNRNPAEVGQPKISLERSEVQACWACTSCFQVNGEKKEKSVCSLM